MSKKPTMKKVIAFVLFSLLFVSCSAPAAAPTQSSAATEPAAPEFAEFPRAECCDGKAIAAGAYQLPRWFSPVVTLQLPDGWRGVRENSVEAVYMIRGETEFANAADTLAFFALEESETAEQFEQDLLAAPEITILGEPTAVTVGGFEAWQVDAQAKPNPDYEGNPEADIPPGTQQIHIFEDYFITRRYFWATFTPEALIRVIVITGTPQDIVVYIEGPVDGFETVAADADAILQTLQVSE